MFKRMTSQKKVQIDSFCSILTNKDTLKWNQRKNKVKLKIKESTCSDNTKWMNNIKVKTTP